MSRQTPGNIRSALWRFRRKPVAMSAMIFILLMAVVGTLAPLIAPHDPARLLSSPFQGPSGEYWFGTDEAGRDVFSRVIYGARLSLGASVSVVAASVCAALVIGLVSGYSGGKIDNLLMRLMDAVQSIPGIVLAITLVAVLGPGLRNAMIAVGVVQVPHFARLVRGQALAVKQEVFVEASLIAGSRHGRIILRRILPGVLSPLIVLVSFELGFVMIVEASLSYLGLGAQPPAASWGLMLSRAYNSILVHPELALAPGLALVLTVLAFTVVGNGLRAALRDEQTRPVRHVQLGMTRVVRRPDAPTAAPTNSDVVLTVENLSVEFDTKAGRLKVVDEVSFQLKRREILGLVGESGSGKTVTSMSIMRLLPSPPALITGGSVWFDGRDLLSLNQTELAAVRGAQISMVFQDPQSSLNPSVPVGAQIAQVLRWHEMASRAEAWARAHEALDHVGVPSARAKAYPHELSGGMRQRVMIAMALVARPQLLIADEPTTALDVTVQAQVLDLLKRLRDELDMTILLVTHDLGVVANTCDRVAVMYAGHVVETAPAERILQRPRHPYTDGLLRAMPTGLRPTGPLHVIPGQVLAFDQLPAGCRFAARCGYHRPECDAPIPLRFEDPVAAHRCVRAGELELGLPAQPQPLEA